MSRRIYFKVTGEDDWQKQLDPHMVSIAILIFYANNLNPLMGEKMMEASISENKFRYEKDLLEEEYTSDNFSAHYGVAEMPELINFIDNHLLIALRNESPDIDIITDIYGGISNFIDQYYEIDYLGYLGINDDEIFEGDTGFIPNLITRAIELRDFFQRVKDLNKPYEVYVE
ncbi:hypothetical protein [Chryseobacterium sp. MMS23-Vi53]|uniref:hypothetical protein n=1 Tax=Chryseobacterium sp. MMS23-Vi53 TaxID=3386644 RepID=UPI0039E91A5A